MSGIIGKKVGMTSLFDAGYSVLPLAGRQAMPRVDTQVILVAAAAYTSAVLVCGEQHKKFAVKPLLPQNHTTNSGLKRILNYETIDQEYFMGYSDLMVSVKNTNQRKGGQK